MLDLSSNMASNRKMDTSDVSGIQFYVELIPSLVIYSPFRFKIIAQNRSVAAFWISRSSGLMPWLFKKTS